MYTSTKKLLRFSYIHVFGGHCYNVTNIVQNNSDMSKCDSLCIEKSV